MGGGGDCHDPGRPLRTHPVFYDHDWPSIQRDMVATNTSMPPVQITNCKVIRFFILPVRIICDS